MNYIKEAENILWYYSDLHRSIQNMDNQIARLVAKQMPKMPGAVVIEPTGIHGSGGQDEAENILFQLQTITENRKKTKSELDKVEELLAEISEEPGCERYCEVLMEWYVYRTPKEEIAKQIGYSERKSIYNLKGKAIKKFAVRYYGIEAVKSM